jgi:hypothetical protein
MWTRRERRKYLAVPRAAESTVCSRCFRWFARLCITDRQNHVPVCMCVHPVIGCVFHLHTARHPFSLVQNSDPTKKAIIYLTCRIHMLGLCSDWRHRTAAAAAPLTRLFSSNWNNCHTKWGKLRAFYMGKLAHPNEYQGISILTATPKPYHIISLRVAS